MFAIKEPPESKELDRAAKNKQGEPDFREPVRVPVASGSIRRI
jgi:hypothetical protein